MDYLFTGFLILCIVATSVFAVLTRRAKDAIPTVMGRKVLTVLSGSMTPTIRTGDVILIRPLQAGEEVHEGDIVTYRTAADARMLITHRVLGVVLVNGTATALVTKGDANSSQDLTTVSPTQVVGKYQFRIPLLGYLTSFVRRPVGIVFVVILPGLALIGMELRRIWAILRELESKEPVSK